MTQVTNRRTGWEVEFNATGPSGELVDLRSIFDEPLEEQGLSKLVLDAGRDQLEACTNPSRCMDDHIAEMEHLFQYARRLKDGLQLHFDPRRRVGTPASVTDFYKPRLQCMLQALQDKREGGAHGVKVVEAGNINAFHCHFDVSELSPDQICQVVCILNMAAPAMLEWIHRKYRIPKSDRNRVWTRFARPERLPAPRWFPNFAAFQKHFESIVQLVEKIGDDSFNKHNGRYRVDLRQKQRWGDPAAEGTKWDAVRYRSQYGTIEFRPLPTLAEPAHMQEVVALLDSWIDLVLCNVGNQSFATFNEAAGSGLVPAFEGIPVPKNKQEWWQRWDRF